MEEYHLTIGSQELFVACDKYPEIHEFFQMHIEFIWLIKAARSCLVIFPMMKKNCFLLTLKENHSQIAMRKARHDVYTTNVRLF